MLWLPGLCATPPYAGPCRCEEAFGDARPDGLVVWRNAVGTWLVHFSGVDELGAPTRLWLVLSAETKPASLWKSGAADETAVLYEGRGLTLERDGLAAVPHWSFGGWHGRQAADKPRFRLTSTTAPELN